MLYASLAILTGFAVLVWGADRFVTGAAATARNLGVSPLVVGLTVVGFGTSAPEMLVGSVAAWLGSPEIAIGNALGSNIANIALILGATAVMVPLSVHSNILRREFPLLMLATLIAAAVVMDGDLTRVDALVLLTMLAGLLYWIVRVALEERHGGKGDPIDDEFDAEIPADMGQGAATFWLIVGLAALLASSRLLVWGATEIAVAFGISDLVIGLTIVAVGTSLPELAASIASARKNEPDIAIGNVIGSNMFNSLAVLGAPVLIQPTAVSAAVLSRDMPMVIGLTVLMFFMAVGSGSHGRINRLEGAVLLAIFLAYQGYLLHGVG
ncbi:MAG: calcium/sodium antiporter [Gammaproteobacteria bacterium]|nr:calcium/sodium antiporter [Gammaproteobacteria bacterium]MCP5135446.1 calcium/sodium antiporter [Gammaproteobacteria bacterium]